MALVTKVKADLYKVLAMSSQDSNARLGKNKVHDPEM